MYTVLAANLVADGLRDAMGREVFTVKDTRERGTRRYSRSTA